MIATAAARRSIDWRRGLIALALAVTFALLAGDLAKVLHAAARTFAFAYDLDYGEGIVWQQMADIVSGRGYAPIGVYPAVVFHYPPVYHLTAAAAARVFALDPLTAGRAVSLASTFAAMLFVGLIAHAAMPRDIRPAAARAAALMAALAAPASPTLLLWASLMRVDMLAAALSLGGLWAAVAALRRPWWVAVAVIAFVLAIFTKQTSVAAPAAAAAMLALARPRLAAMLTVGCVTLGLAATAWLEWKTGGQFLHHILFYNLNRVDLGRWLLLAKVLLSNTITISIAVLAAIAAVRRLGGRTLPARVAGDDAAAACFAILAYVAIKTLMIPMILKSGAADNYLIDWLLGLAMLVGLGAAPVIDVALGGAARPRPLLVGLVAIGLWVQAGRLPWVHPLDPAMAPALDRVVARIAASPRPVISDDMTLPIRAGQPVRWEPAIAAELAHAGVYDDRAFARLVRAGAFGFFVTDGNPGDRRFDQRYNPVVVAAIEAAYPRREQAGPLTLHLPADQGSTSGGTRASSAAPASASAPRARQNQVTPGQPARVQAMPPAEPRTLDPR